MSTVMTTRLSHPLLRFILFFVLALAVSAPATALAAPAGQGAGTAEDEAVLLAYYESELMSTDDFDVVVGLSLYDDYTFEMALDYQDGEDPSIGYGDWEETDDGILLTLIGADDEDFDEPADLELTWDADDSLVIAGAEDGLLGEEDIILYPTDVENEDDADEDADDTEAVAVGGVYISPVEATEAGDGVVYLLNLLPDGSASLNSDYLNLEPPVFELGTWTDNGDDTVTVEITGTPDEDYDEPIVIELEVGEYGELSVDELYIYPLSWLSEDVDDDTEGYAGEGEVYVYVAEVISPDSGEPLVVYLMLYDDGTVILTDEEQTETLYGEWTLEDATLTITITGNDDEDFDEPVEMTFEYNEDAALVGVDYPTDVFGEDELIFYPSDDGTEDEAVTEGEFYIFESEPLPSEETDGIVVSLVLADDGAALMSYDYMNDEDPVLDYGEWTRDEDEAVIVTITEGPDGEYDEPYIFTFEEDPDDLSLWLVEESVEIFGDTELVLYRIQ